VYDQRKSAAPATTSSALVTRIPGTGTAMAVLLLVVGVVVLVPPVVPVVAPPPVPCPDPVVGGVTPPEAPVPGRLLEPDVLGDEDVLELVLVALLEETDVLDEVVEDKDNVDEEEEPSAAVRTTWSMFIWPNPRVVRVSLRFVITTVCGVLASPSFEKSINGGSPPCAVLL